MAARLLLLACFSAALAGCSAPPVIGMKNPSTGEVRDCKNHGHYSYMLEIGSAADCYNDLKAQGWDYWRY